jgi:hypothetical protein
MTCFRVKLIIMKNGNNSCLSQKLSLSNFHKSSISRCKMSYNLSSRCSIWIL